MAHNGRKVGVMVRVAPAHGVPVSGFVFLSLPANGCGAGTVADLFNSEEAFLPFQRTADGLTMLLAKSNIQWVAQEPDDSPDLFTPAPSGIIREELVEVRFPGGLSLGGLMVLELSDEKKRASDFLNGSRPFFRLVAPSGLVLVNKSAVLDITVFETSPVPDLPS